MPLPRNGSNLIHICPAQPIPVSHHIRKIHPPHLPHPPPSPSLVNNQSLRHRHRMMQRLQFRIPTRRTSLPRQPISQPPIKVSRARNRNRHRDDQQTDGQHRKRRQ